MTEIECPRCGEEVDSSEPLDSQQNTKLHPCEHIISAADYEAAYEEATQ